MSLFDVTVTGFRLNAGERPAAALARALNLAPEAAAHLVRRFPVVVKKGVPVAEARRVEQALHQCGAWVKVEPVSKANDDAPALLATPEVLSKRAAKTWLEFQGDDSSSAPTPPPPLWAQPPSPETGAQVADPWVAELRIPSLERAAKPVSRRPAAPLNEVQPSSDAFDFGSKLDANGLPPSVALEVVGAAPSGLARTTSFGADLELPWVEGPALRAAAQPAQPLVPPRNPDPFEELAPQAGLELAFDPHRDIKRR